MDYVLNGIIKSNMDILFNRKKIISSDPNYYYGLILKKYLDLRNEMPDPRYGDNNQLQKRKTYANLMTEKYDESIEMISEWLDAREEKRKYWLDRKSK